MRQYLTPLAIVMSAALASAEDLQISTIQERLGRLTDDGVLASAEDLQISTIIHEKLSHEKETGNLRDIAIDFQVENGRVSLAGRVSSIEQQQLVLKIAQSVGGVNCIVDKLQVVDSDETPPTVSENRGSKLQPSAASAPDPPRQRTLRPLIGGIAVVLAAVGSIGAWLCNRRIRRSVEREETC